MTPKKHSRLWRFIFVLHLYAFVAGLGFVLFSGLLIWKSPRVRGWVHSELARLYLRKVAPRLPFTIEDIDIDANWDEFQRGEIRDLSVSLLWNGWTIRLKGPILIARHQEKHFVAQFKPVVEFEPPAKMKKKVPRMPPLPIDLSFKADEDLRHLDDLNIHTHLKSWAWKEVGLSLDDVLLNINWDGDQARIKASAHSVHLADAELNRNFDIQDVDFSGDTLLKLVPFQLGPTVGFSLTALGGESQWEKKKWNLPLQSLPLHGSVVLSDGGEVFDLNIGSEKIPDLSLNVVITDQPKGQNVDLRWKTQDLSVPKLLAGAFSMGQLGDLLYLKKLAGKLQSWGSAQFVLPLAPDFYKTAQIDGDLKVKNVAFEWAWKYLAVSGLNLDLPFSNEDGLQGTLSIDRILFRRLKAKLAPTQIDLTPSESGLKNFQVKVGGENKEIPLTISGRSLQLGNLEGTASLPDKKEPMSYSLTTALHMKPTEVSDLLSDICLKPSHVPPAQVSLNFSDIFLKKGTVDPTGDARIDLFDGSVTVGELGFFDMDTNVPEVDFTLDVDRIKLSKLGDWSGFGEMDGVLHVYAHDVVIQGWLPTQYDFLFETRPLNHSKVLFSPDAAKNLGRLVAADAMNGLPGVADWITFGWPSRILLGGFDINYVGISLFSHNGSIMLETLDPPSNVSGEKHYIVSGKRFKIPLNAPHYPVLVDETAVSNYVKQLMNKLNALKEKKNAKEKKPEKPQLDCASPTL